MFRRRPVVSALSVASLCVVVAATRGRAGATLENSPADIATMQAHYRVVCDELEARDVTGLGAGQRDRRAEALAELRAYCERGIFGIDPTLEGRTPRFKDATGRLCAVANLMDATGERELLDQLAATANDAYIVELATQPDLLGWLDRVGLSLDEAARIHGPLFRSGSGTGSGGGGPTFNTPGGLGGPGAKPSSAPTKPSWGAGAQPGAPSSAPSSSAPASPGLAVPSSASSGPGREFRTGAAWTPDGGEEDWWLWWEMNKLRFLRPNRLQEVASAGLRSLGGGSADASATLEAARAGLRPLLVELTRAEDAMLRARAAVALGRIAGREAIVPLTALLADPQVLVRHAAILGLGATGSMEAAPTLLDLAADGSDVSDQARPLAVVALGLGRRHGMSATLDGFVVDLVAQPRDGHDELRTAALLYHTLSPCEELQGLALAALDERKTTEELRCRATETLRLAGDAAQLPRLTRLLGDGHVEVRRSAALALSGLSHPLALAALKTAYELEEEPLARGFVLLAVAEQGGPAAQDFLVRAAKGGAAKSRPWAALGLGLLARSATDPEARESACAVLREGLGSDANHSTRGAWMLAAGIARDAGSAPRLRTLLTRSSDQKLRMFAALSLGMIGDEEARPLLLELLELENAPLALIGVTQALGAYGVADDGPEMARAVEQVKVPATQSLLALALAFHGSDAAVEGLMRIARDEQAAGATRAAAVEGLGQLLDPRPDLLLAEVSASSNFAVFPEWMNGLLTTFTL